MVLKLSIAVVATLMLASSAPALAQSLTGRAEAIDGDTLAFTGTRVRLFGIDAAELEQTCSREGQQWACGEDAKTALAALVADQQIDCVGRENDIYGRLVAICKAGSIDLAEAMIGSGLAITSSTTNTNYIASEARARTLRLGLWAASFDVPADWRAAHAAEEAPVKRAEVTYNFATSENRSSPRSGCNIKGNHSRKGEWIYHLPGQAYYAQTRAEQVFCTEEAAQRAGYRRSKV